ncbi:Gfo/Idh/MocA family oxidoreductase [Herbidospora galbida]|uniref:Gfo/Idh/MocA family oxidoreductase n=1 Tax=Herbidospora galbida TaxID=2575442 RepID=A0A4U3LW56_9ACTN|nr:Gfo/Idh/MocA family oxidoreductase [Herbidospora galbida]TKK79056.1 Gfo/Idh/MocA family oxidoreductase [Herbidospora galbida]
MGEPVKVGMIGCGKVSVQYTTTLANLPGLVLYAVADLDPARALAAATETGARSLGVDDLIDACDLVVNLTIPAAHTEVALRAIAAGKDVYGEKPLAATLDEAKTIIAKGAGVKLGCAPDTVLGTGFQTARHHLDAGLIGRPAAAVATMVTGGPEPWHPDPDFYYRPGGGPLLDMGPYYVTALVALLGPVVSVIGASSRARSERVIGSGHRQGERLPVTTDTHVTGVLTHASGALSTLIMSFDGATSRAPNIEVHGELGTMIVPDPNRFDGDVLVHRVGGTWETLPVAAGYRDTGRGIGVYDLVTAPRPRASGEVALHVLDVMESLLRSAATGRAETVESTCERPEPVPLQSLV